MNAAQIIQFQKPSQPAQGAGKSMYSDKFDQGYVMSSRLYRKEVWPFLSDAARNVYAELENRINGHNKESDFVSYSQLQGGDLPGARKLSRETVRNGIDELLKLKVVSIAGTGSRGVKKYVLNEVSLKDQFTNKTSSTTEPVRKVNQTSSTTEPITSSETEHTIDTPIESLEDDDIGKFTVQNRPLTFVEYHASDRTAVSFKELSQKYPVKDDFVMQAKACFPGHSVERIFETLKTMAQWSLDKSNQTPQKWMTTWLGSFMKNTPSDAELAAARQRTAKKTQKSKNNLDVNAAWEKAEYQPVSAPVDIPEDFL